MKSEEAHTSDLSWGYDEFRHARDAESTSVTRKEFGIETRRADMSPAFPEPDLRFGHETNQGRGVAARAQEHLG